VKLLRVLDGVPYYRLGGSKKVNVNVRVVAATNQNLEELTQAGRFRRDLYHRLAQFKLEIPPLRERPEDILGIAEHILHEHVPESRFTRDAVTALVSYSWPGNVRELQNAVFHAIMHAKNPQKEITASELNVADSSPAAPASAAPLDGDLSQIERQIIFQTLERFGGNQSKAAQALGISRRTLVRKLRNYRRSGCDKPAASLSLEQKQYYRAELNQPVKMKYSGKQIQATLMNISLGGAAIYTETPVEFGAPVTIYFVIPETDMEAELPGRVVWSGHDFRHGVQFVETPPGIRTLLQQWLMAQMKKNGWACDMAV
jgi:DNA-binding XRE family transcriptional regulator